MSLEVVILVGLQGSGKSTFFRERFAATHAHVSKDNFPNRRRPSIRQRQEIEAALKDGRSVIVDNTNPTLEDRAAIIGISREFGARTVGYFFEATVNECRERNRARVGKAQVPDVAIFVTAKRLVAPSLEEGFDALYRVRVADGAFEVAPYSGS